MNKSVATQRNGTIDLMRFVFCYMVVMFHFYDNGVDGYLGGKFGVEYFVILSGFLFYSAWKRKLSRDASQEAKFAYWKDYMVKRYCYFFTFAFVAFIIIFIVARVWIGEIDNLGHLGQLLSGDVWEILLIKMCGFNRNKSLLNAPAWTLGCMLIAEFVILGFLVFWEKKFVHLFLPCSLMMGCAYWINMESASVARFLGLFTFGTLRTYLLIGFGILSYYLYVKLKQLSFTNCGKWCLTCLEVGGYLLSVIISYKYNTRYYQFCTIFILLIAIAISFSNQSYTGKLIKGTAFTSFLGEYSFCIYLSHMSVLKSFRYIYGKKESLYIHSAEFSICVLIIGLLFLLTMRFVIVYRPKIVILMKKAMLSNVK